MTRVRHSVLRTVGGCAAALVVLTASMGGAQADPAADADEEMERA